MCFLNSLRRFYKLKRRFCNNTIFALFLLVSTGVVEVLWNYGESGADLPRSKQPALVSSVTSGDGVFMARILGAINTTKLKEACRGTRAPKSLAKTLYQEKKHFGQWVVSLLFGGSILSLRNSLHCSKVVYCFRNWMSKIRRRMQHPFDELSLSMPN